MKKIISLIAICVLLSVSLAKGNSLAEEENQIKKLVTSAYVDGLLNGGDLEVTKKGFYEGFKLLIFRKDKIQPLPIANWIKGTQRSKDTQPERFKNKFKPNFKMIKITGNAAAVQLELSQKGKLVYTDFLSLYKYSDGWKIVGKIFYQHK